MGRNVVVVGGGISGLSVAHELLRRSEGSDLGIVCLEAADLAGGSLGSARESGFLCESAANGFLDGAPDTVALVRRLGLEPRLVRARDAARRRFVYRGGRLHEAPLSPLAFARSRALPLAGKLRLLCEPWVRRRPPEAPEESVYEFAVRRLGRSATRVLVDAVVSGICAGDIHRLSLPGAFPALQRMERDHGSLLRAAWAGRGDDPGAGPGRGGLTSFDEGMQVLIDALASELGSRLSTDRAVHRVTSLGRRGFRVHFRQGAPMDATAVVLACPAWATTSIVGEMDAELAGALAEIRSAPVVAVHTGFRRAALGRVRRAFGFLVPRGEGPRLLGVIQASDVFDGRAPEGSLLLTAMLGGAHDPGAATLTDSELLNTVRRDLQTTLDVHVEPYMTRIVRHRHGIPQYEMGHPERVENIDRLCRQHPGLWLSGWSLRGISVNATIEESRGVAEGVLEHLRQQPAHGTEEAQ